MKKQDKTSKSEGCHYLRKAWTQLNWLRTGVGRFKLNMIKIGLIPSTIVNVSVHSSKLRDTFLLNALFKASLHHF